MSPSNTKPPDQDDLMTENEDPPGDQQQQSTNNFQPQEPFYFESKGRFYKAPGAALFKHLLCQPDYCPLHRNHCPLKRHWNRPKRSQNRHPSRSTSRRSKPRQTRVTSDAERARLSVHAALPSTVSSGIWKPALNPCHHLAPATSAGLTRASASYPAHGQRQQDRDRGEESYPFRTYHLPSSHISLPMRSRHSAISDSERGQDQQIDPPLDAGDPTNQSNHATTHDDIASTSDSSNAELDIISSYEESVESLFDDTLANEGDYFFIDASAYALANEEDEWVVDSTGDWSRWGEWPEPEDWYKWGCER